MEFGVQFFPDVGPDVKPADRYWSECLDLAALADQLGYSHVRTVEHHFQSYGGYSPNPHIFLAAVAARTRNVRLITGAILPIFNHPLKIAGEIGMVDAISGGRLECGFARAFLPSEFEAFGRKLDESKARFAEGLEQIRLLLEQENVTSKGAFHSFENITSFPRPTQKPRPPFWIAALSTPDSFVNAGAMGHNVMAIPLFADAMKDLIGLYRDGRRNAGLPGKGKVMLAHHMFCYPDDKKAAEIAKGPLDRYLQSIVHACKPWLTGTKSKDYVGYDKVLEILSKETTESQIAKGAAFIGSPEKLIDQINEYQERTGGFETVSLQVNFNDLPVDAAERSMRLFAEKVLPKIK